VAIGPGGIPRARHCEGEELIPDAVAVELAVGIRQDAGFVHGMFEKLSECCGGRCCHLVLQSEGQRAAAIMAGAVSQITLGCRLGAFAC
jgi:hypothetical protein